jgi:maltose-binding protein MalE
MKSRFTILVGLVLALALVAAACSDDDDTGAEDTTTTAAQETTTTAAETTTTAAETTTTAAADLAALTVWADDKFAPIITQVAEPFTAETGVPVEVTLIDYQDMRAQIVVAAPAGEGPDLFIGGHDWLGEAVENGIAAPVDLGSKEANLTEVSLNALNWNGTQHALPYAVENVALYYNTDLIETPPTTVEELTAICDELGDAIDNCWGIQGGGSAPDAYHNFPFVSAGGGYIFGFSPETGFDTTDIGVDSDGAIAGVTALETLVADGYIAGIDEDDAKQFFIDGKQAFFMSGPWWINTWDEAGINYGVAPLPTLEGNPMGPFVGVRGFFVNEFGLNKAIAEEFLLNFIATDETMLALHEADPRGPTWIPTLEAIGDDPVFSAFGASGANGQFMPNVPEMGSVWDPLGNQLLAVRQGQLDAQTAMTQAAEQIAAAVGG